MQDTGKVIPLRQTLKKGKLPVRPKNNEVREREYLTEKEVTRLMDAAKQQGRHGLRDHTMIYFMFRHGLRVTELIHLKTSQLDLEQGLLHVVRVKRGRPSVHHIAGSCQRLVRRLLRDYPTSPYLFQSERGGTLTGSGIRKIIKRAGKAAKLPFPVHPHMLRHACGYKLANEGHDTRSIQHYLGHKNIQHTVRYTELSSDRFKDFWRD